MAMGGAGRVGGAASNYQRHLGRLWPINRPLPRRQWGGMGNGHGVTAREIRRPGPTCRAAGGRRRHCFFSSARLPVPIRVTRPAGKPSAARAQYDPTALTLTVVVDLTRWSHVLSERGHVSGANGGDRVGPRSGPGEFVRSDGMS